MSPRPRRPAPAGPPLRGRPALPEGARRGQTIGLRLSPAERELIARKAEAAQVTPAEYVRRAALDTPPPRPVPEANREAYRALGPLGTNLNQLVERIHAGRVAVVQSADLAVIAAIGAEVHRLRLALLGRRVPRPSSLNWPGSAADDADLVIRAEFTPEEDAERVRQAEARRAARPAVLDAGPDPARLVALDARAAAREERHARQRRVGAQELGEGCAEAAP